MQIGQAIGRVIVMLLVVLLAIGLAGGAFAAVPASEAARLNAEARELLRSDPNRAQQLAQDALTIAQRDRDAGAEAGARIVLGSIERQRGRYDQAVIEFERAVDIARAAPGQVNYANALANLGISLDLGGLYADALEVQSEALAVFEAQGDTARVSAVLINLGNTLDNLGDQKRAREHYQRALDTKRANGIDKGLGSVLNNLADLALESGTTEQAIELLDQAIAAHARDDDRVGEGLALVNRGIAKARAGRFDAALADIQQGEAIARELEHSLGIAAALRARAEVWLLRAKSLDGEARDYALTNAEREARAAIVSSDREEPERQLRAKRLLAEVLAERQDAVGALALMAEIEKTEARLRAARDDERIAVVRARYQNQRQESDLALSREREATQSAQLARNRLLLRSAAGAAIAALIAIVLLVWIARERRLRTETLRTQQVALREAFEHAEHERRRARRAADLNQRLLALAGEDLQAPLVEIRGAAERMLTTHPDLSRPLAAIARNASDLMQIVLRMRASAQNERDEAATLPRVDLSALVQAVVGDVEPRASQRQQRLYATIAPALSVAGSADALLHVCTELLDHTIRLNPADSRIDVRLRAEAGQAVLTLSDHDGALRQLLLERQRPTLATGRDAGARRLGLGLLRETIVHTGGEIDSIAASAPETGQLLRVMLPLMD